MKSTEVLDGKYPSEVPLFSTEAGFKDCVGQGVLVYNLHNIKVLGLTPVDPSQFKLNFWQLSDSLSAQLSWNRQLCR